MIPIDHSQHGREPIMAGINRTYISLYDPRIRLIDDALKQNSKLGEKEAVELARHVLYVIDHVPRRVR
jgi:hypothetical protein